MSIWIKSGSVMMMLGVVMGAFGAHGLKSTLSPAMMEVYQTAVFYHLIHALGLFIVAWVKTLSDSKLVTSAGFLFLAGILLFQKNRGNTGIKTKKLGWSYCRGKIHLSSYASHRSPPQPQQTYKSQEWYKMPQ